MGNIIYYFSGTGNSLAVALSIAKKLSNTKVESIMNLFHNKEISLSYEKIGFVYPCYYVHPPKVVTEAVNDMYINERQRIFLVVTYAGRYGYCLTDMKQLLQQYTKYGVQGFSMRMPGSHILGYPEWPKFYQHFLFGREDKRIDKIAHGIQNNISTDFKKPTILEKLFADTKAIKISRFDEMGSLFYVTKSCDKCGICAKICPLNNIKVSSTEVKWGNRCQQCMACIQWCPQKAIAYPSIPIDRTHYHHPNIGLIQMLQYR